MRIIHTADWHLRADRPRCRLDKDWIATQRKVLEHIVALVQEHDAILTVGGDVFDTPRTTPEIVNLLLSTLAPIKERVWILAGNHDLPYHNLENVERASIGTLLHHFNDLETHPDFTAFHFGREKEEHREVVFVHQLVFPSKKEQVMGAGTTAQALLERFPRAKTILTGDYHHSFVVEMDGRRVVNPGCITRQVADMADYKSVVMLLEGDEVTPLYLPDTEPLVTDEYLRKEEEREERIEAFLEKLEGKEISLSFKDNLREKSENLTGKVAEITQEILEALHES